MDLTFLQMRQTIITLYTFKKNKAEQGDRDAKRELPLRKCFISLCYSLIQSCQTILSRFLCLFYSSVEVNLQVSFSVFYNQSLCFFIKIWSILFSSLIVRKYHPDLYRGYRLIHVPVQNMCPFTLLYTESVANHQVEKKPLLNSLIPKCYTISQVEQTSISLN